MCSSSASGSWSEVTTSAPPGRTSLLIGWTPYHAHDSMPLHIVSSTTIETAPLSGSKRASDDSIVVSGDDGKVLGRNAVTLRRIAVTSERRTDFAFPAGSEHHAARDAIGKPLLKDAAVYHL